MGKTPLESWVSRKLLLSEPLTLARLQEYQICKLRESLAHVIARSRFYREHLKGTDPASIRSMQDMAQIPFTTPAMLAGRFNDFLCVPPGDIGRIVTLFTSGTTGSPKKIAFTPEDQELTVDFFQHGMATLAGPADRVVIFLPGKTEGSVGDLLKKGLDRLGCEGIVFGPVADYRQALRTILDANADCAVGIPSQLLALSRYRETGVPCKRVQLKSVLLSTDYVPQSIADSLAQTWGCEVYGHYGMTEMGLGGGVECSARNGYHMREGDLLFEIIDPVTGSPVRDGEYGEVVFSTLTRRGMPLVRYRTGDRSRFLVQPCPCGSVLRRMERIAGRISEAVRLHDGSLISMAQIDEILFRDPRVSAYCAEIFVKDGRDCLVLIVRFEQGFPDVQQLLLELRRHLSIDDLVRQGHLNLDIREGDAGYFTTGTAKRFIADRRNEGQSATSGKA